MMLLPAVRSLFLLALCALPLSAAEGAAFGVVAADVEAATFAMSPDSRSRNTAGGTPVDSVWPGSPADKAGVKKGDIIMTFDGSPVPDRAALSALLAQHRPGDTVQVELLSDGQRRTLTVTLTARPARAAKLSATPDKAIGGDRVKRPVVVSPEIRAAMKERRAAICARLATLPDMSDKDAEAVIDELQAIRNLARDANGADKDWMPGKAGEATLQLRDSEGTLLLNGANNSLTLEVYDTKGALLYRGKLDTPEQRRALPAPVLERLQKL